MNIRDKRSYEYFLRVCKFLGFDYDDDDMDIQPKEYSPTGASYETYYGGEELSSFHFRTEEDMIKAYTKLVEQDINVSKFDKFSIHLHY